MTVIIAELSRARSAQRSTMGKEIWLSVHPRNFNLVLRKSSVRLYVRPPLYVSRSEILHFKYPRVSVVNRIATRTFKDKKITTIKPILSFDLTLISTLTCITDKEPQREIKNKGHQFRWKNNVKILKRRWEKMRNASGHEGENEWERKKREQERIQHFLPKTSN